MEENKVVEEKKDPSPKKTDDAKVDEKKVRDVNRKKDMHRL